MILNKMIKSGLVVQNKFLAGNAYPSDYDPQGRTGSYQVVRPAKRDKFDTGFEATKTISPYQQTVEEYSTAVPGSVFRPRRQLRAKNIPKYGQTAYRTMFGGDRNPVSDYLVQRVLGLVDNDSRMSESMVVDDPLRVYRSGPSSSSSSSIPGRPTIPSSSSSSSRPSDVVMGDVLSPVGRDSVSGLTDIMANMGRSGGDTPTSADIRGYEAMSPSANFLPAFSETASNPSIGTTWRSATEPGPEEFRIARQRARLAEMDPQDRFLRLPRYMGATGAIQPPTYEEANPPPAYNITYADAEAIVDSNPSTVLNVTGNNIEQQTELGPAVVPTYPRTWGPPSPVSPITSSQLDRIPDIDEITSPIGLVSPQVQEVTPPVTVAEEIEQNPRVGPGVGIRLRAPPSGRVGRLPINSQRGRSRRNS